MDDTLIPAAWDRQGLEAIGFEGFVPLVGLPPKAVPIEHGIYMVLRLTPGRPVISDVNPVVRAGLRTYSAAELELRWHESTPVVYIGKAAPSADDSMGLRERLRPFSSKSASHSGGRSIWQLADADDLIVCWRRYEEAPAREQDYLRAFRAAHNGQLPFANRNGGRNRKKRPGRVAATPLSSTPEDAALPPDGLL